MSRTALISGITGQDGAYLAAILLEQGYDVHGFRPYAATDDLMHLRHIDGLQLHYGDVTDTGNLCRLIDTIQPDEIYNLGAMSHVHVSFDSPETTAQINAIGCLKMLEAMRIIGSQKQIKLYQASSSEMFGSSPAPQNEATPFAPCSPYATAKLFAYWSVKNYRESYGVFASNGILFNHESPLRGEHFVTQKIIQAVAAIKKGQQETLSLGNLNAKRDWGHAHDYMRAATMILQHDTADDFVIATGKAISVRDFVTMAFASVDITLEWQGETIHERGIDRRTGKPLVVVDPSLFRPNEVNILQGDAQKAQSILGWQPKFTLDDLIQDMITAARND